MIIETKYLLSIWIFTRLATISEGQWVVDDDGCRTPDGGTGSCIPIKDCEHVTNIIQNAIFLSQNFTDEVRSYYCGTINKFVKVCCPSNSKIISKQPELPSDNTCKAPNGDIGTCISVHECKPITDFVQNSLPLSLNAIEMLKNYHCGGTTNSVKVCCPKNPIVLQTSTTTAKPPENECQTPDNNIGSCIPIKECQHITDFFHNSWPLSQKSFETIKSYECRNKNSVNVCCPNHPIVVELASRTLPSINEQAPDVTNHVNLKLLPDSCGYQFGSSRITGGIKAELFEFPWMALLSYNTRTVPMFKCGGTIINEWYILTAAHCITSSTLIGVRIGEHNISSERDCEKQHYGDEYCAPAVQDIAIEEVIPHPNFNNKLFANDIGLIRLASRIDTTVDNAKPICLPITEDLRKQNFTNINVTVAGWGNTEEGYRSADLLKVSMPVVTDESCRKAYNKSAAQINKVKQICAGGQHQHDSCTGDSGGPMQLCLPCNGEIKCVQFGVVSFGPKICGQEGFPGVYTKVDYYMDWILDNIKS